MNTRKLLVQTAFFMGLCTFAAEPWQDPAVNAENRLPARTYLPREGFMQSLNGTWSFAWEGSADGAIAMGDPATTETPFSIDAPSCVETRGWGVPHYVNIRYPHPMTPPTIDPKYNPTMLYRRTFTVPESWKGKRIVLRFEGVASCCEVWVNGKKAGYFEDARLPSEFDITALVTLGATNNTVTARVRKWCDGSYAEDQDMIRYAGIFRDVTLYAEEPDGIYDFSFTTIPDAGYVNWTCRLELFGGEMAVKAAHPRLLDAAGKEVGAFSAAPDGKALTLRLAAPRLWSDEDPYLYTLDLGDGRRVAVGVRECKVDGGRILVNGRPVKFKGVNRHEMSPENGYTLTLEEMEQDVRLMRRNNINCVRMAHYPNDRRMSLWAPGEPSFIDGDGTSEDYIILWNHDGGWRYTPDAGDSDLSCSGWALMALRSARLNGAVLPDDAIEKAVLYIKRAQRANDGAFGYQGDNGQHAETLTGAAILCLELCGRHLDPDALKGAQFVRKTYQRSLLGGGNLPAVARRRRQCLLWALLYGPGAFSARWRAMARV